MKKYRNEITAFAAGLIISALVFTAPSLLPESSFSGTRTADANIVAVTENREGVMGKVKVKIRPGDGEVLLETNPFVKTNTQASAKTAKKVAAELTDTSLARKDVIYSFNVSGKVIGGPSAGAAMTLATIAAIKEEKVPESIAVTGTIRPDGKIGRIGGVLEKSYTAGENGLDTFYVPEGQKNLTYYRRVVTEDVFYPGLLSVKDVEYRPEKISIEEITREKYGMNVTAVSNIQELYSKIYKK